MKPRKRSARSGFTLLELLIAVVIVGFSSIGMLRLLVTGAQASRNAGALGYRTAVLNAQVSRIASAPPGSLTDGTTTTTVTTLPFTYTLTVTVATSGSAQSVTITVTPTGAGAISAVTRVISRTVATSSDPFST
jgi:prepilin-type N-terminal cleavage/methylation domain-containing protein